MFSAQTAPNLLTFFERFCMRFRSHTVPQTYHTNFALVYVRYLTLSRLNRKTKNLMTICRTLIFFFKLS